MKTRCPLLLVADYRFYKDMGSSNTKTTINYLVQCLLRSGDALTTGRDGQGRAVGGGGTTQCL